HFKQFNDEYGHLVGDEVLIAVGNRVQETVRTEDILARYGGEEFVVIARDTPADKATILGERIRVAIERSEVPAEAGPLKVTTSVGVPTYDERNLQPSGIELGAAADRALYAAKEAGRNTVRHVDDLPVG